MKIQCENCGHVYETNKQEPYFISENSIGIDCPKCGAYTNAAFFESYRVEKEAEQK